MSCGHGGTVAVALKLKKRRWPQISLFWFYLIFVFSGCAVSELTWKERLSEHYEKIFCYCFSENYEKNVLLFCLNFMLLLFPLKYILKFL